jgi:CheY-like chemotaxis protein
MKILLVDDNKADVFLVQDAIVEEGFPAEIHTADDGEAAIELIRGVDDNPEEPCFDVFLVDLHLPRKSGAEVVRTIRASTRCVDAPVIVITSAVAPTERDRILDSGATHVVVKPNRLAEFRALAKLIRAASGDLPVQ